MHEIKICFLRNDARDTPVTMQSGRVYGAEVLVRVSTTGGEVRVLPARSTLGRRVPRAASPPRNRESDGHMLR